MQGQATALGDRLTSARDRAARAQAAAEQTRAEVARRRHILADAEEACQAAQESARGAEDNLGHLERAHAAHALRGTLAVGQPCPVCATRVQRVPAIEPVDDLEHARRAQEEARRQFTDAQETAQRAIADVAVAESALRASTAALAELRSELDHLASELRAALPPDLHEDSHWAEILQTRVDAAATSRAASDREVEAAQHRVAELASALARIDGELRTVPAQIDERRRAAAAIRDGCEETEGLLTALLGRAPGPNAASELAAMDARLGGAEEALASAMATTQEARDRLRKAQGAAERAAAEVEAEADRARARGEERSRLTHERGEIQRTLQGIVPGRPDVVDAIAIELEALIAARARRDTTHRELAERQQERASMDRRAAELSARLDALDRQFDEHRERERVASEAMNVALTDLAVRLVAAGITLDGHGDEHDELAEVARRTKDERDAVVRRAAELGAQEQALAEKIGRATQCREQRDAARTRMEVSRELGQLLGANNLQTHVLTDAMRVLVEDGSLHLQRLSDGRYRLSAQDLDFEVVDAWNGDAVRSVKTLSGGETFLTSLALALALAERLADLAAGAHGHEALESLFVDEGFGALDTEETLETVVQAIEALQAHDRLVGIVTHLTPLAERMPAQIKVRKAPEGSQVEMVK
jgi:DNA repair protein SbcC/Rad50